MKRLLIIALMCVTGCFSKVGGEDGEGGSAANDGHGGEGGMGMGGFGGSTSSAGIDTDRDGWSKNQGDCDDYNVDRNPGESERCNGLDDNCNGDVDEGCGGDGGAGGSTTTSSTTSTTSTTTTSTTSTTIGQSKGSLDTFFIWDGDMDVDEPVTVRLWIMNSPNPFEDGESACVMTNWGVEGPNEVLVCPFTLPKGSTVIATVYTAKSPQMTKMTIFDMCDYPGGAGNCSGLGDFCEDGSNGVVAPDGHDHVVGRDFWVLRDDLEEGDNLPISFVNNGDDLDEGKAIDCDGNLKVMIPVD